ncbi:MAG: carboxypeptidase regulatory-like domain-containing protein [Candidatus Poribacteria bacterium]|nr:carboxypeptidase regulatory-like domain-containing protein [Candidatus Poribacteria bacterium]
MTISNFRRYILIIFIGMVISTLIISCGNINNNIIIEDKKQPQTTISGRVMDVQGKPVAGVEIGIRAVELAERDSFPRPSATLSGAVTNANGHFSFTNIPSGTTELLLLPERRSDFEIKTVQIEGLTIYATKYNSLRQMPFVVESGEHLKDVEVTVLPRMKIRAQIVFDDGIPLVNALVKLNIQPRMFWDSSARFDGSVKTDSDGYLAEYVREAATYTVSAEYYNYSTISEPILLKDGEQSDTLILKLIEKTPTDKSNISETNSRLSSHERWKARQAIWAVNPTNGHAYKTISCKSWYEAVGIAKAENAYLVTINDETEQKWIESLFSQKDYYWIGLRLSEKREQWHNQEPVTYTNWGNQKSREIPTDKGEVYIAMDAATKKWIGIDARSPFRYLVKKAILEKNITPAKSR